MSANVPVDSSKSEPIVDFDPSLPIADSPSMAEGSSQSPLSVQQKFRLAVRKSWRRLKTADPSTFDELRGDEPFAQIAFGFPQIVESIATLSGYGETADWDTFPLDARGLPWIERYLIHFVRPAIAEFAPNAEPTKAIGASGGSAEDNLQMVRVRLFMAATIFGQCLAQENQFRWAQDPHSEGPHGVLTTGKGSASEFGVSPYWKPKKFVALGEEDSLVRFSSVVAKHLQVQQLLKPATEQFYSMHPEYTRGADDHRFVTWCDDNDLPVEMDVMVQDELVYRVRLASLNAPPSGD